MTDYNLIIGDRPLELTCAFTDNSTNPWTVIL